MTVAVAITVEPNQDRGVIVELLDVDNGEEVGRVVVVPGATYRTHVWDARGISIRESDDLAYPRRAKYEDMAYSPVAQ